MLWTWLMNVVYMTIHEVDKVVDVSFCVNKIEKTKKHKKELFGFDFGQTDDCSLIGPLFFFAIQEEEGVCLLFENVFWDFVP